MTEEEEFAMQAMIQASENAARQKAQSLGKGPLVTQQYVEKAATKARDEAHDRFHARMVAEALAPPEELEQMVPVEGMVPLKVLAGLDEKMKKQQEGQR
jgi:hypothetical protein